MVHDHVIDDVAMTWRHVADQKKDVAAPMTPIQAGAIASRGSLRPSMTCYAPRAIGDAPFGRLRRDSGVTAILNQEYLNMNYWYKFCKIN